MTVAQGLDDRDQLVLLTLLEQGDDHREGGNQARLLPLHVAVVKQESGLRIRDKETAIEGPSKGFLLRTDQLEAVCKEFDL
jgi:hypothetical protein